MIDKVILSVPDGRVEISALAGQLSVLISVSGAAEQGQAIPAPVAVNLLQLLLQTYPQYRHALAMWLERHVHDAFPMEAALESLQGEGG